MDLGDDFATEKKLGLKPWAEELDEVERETMRQGGDKEIHSIGPSLQRRPDFQKRLKEWRLLHGLPATVDCSARPLGMDDPLVDELPASGITTVPQPSIANNIFRKQKIILYLFDFRVTDGDTVDVYFNDTYRGTYTLPSELLSTALFITLEPSDLLEAKTNVLKFVGVSSGSVSDPAITIGVKAAIAADIFSGSEIAVTGSGHANTFVGGEVTMNLALGLACVDPALYPESARHIRQAQALGYERIVTKDTDRARKNARRAASTKVCRQTPVPGLDCDEYPQAMFVENAGTAHVKKIASADNQGSGSKIGKYATPHLEFGQLEVVVPNRGLDCENAF